MAYLCDSCSPSASVLIDGVFIVRDRLLLDRLFRNRLFLEHGLHDLQILIRLLPYQLPATNT